MCECICGFSKNSFSFSPAWRSTHSFSCLESTITAPLSFHVLPFVFHLISAHVEFLASSELRNTHKISALRDCRHRLAVFDVLLLRLGPAQAFGSGVPQTNIIVGERPPVFIFVSAGPLLPGLTFLKTGGEGGGLTKTLLPRCRPTWAR